MPRGEISDVKDWRSTGRKRGRRALFAAHRLFVCVGVRELNISCGRTTKFPPPDAPEWFEELWPEEKRELTQLQVDHENKDWTDNDPANLEWRCPSCHRLADNQTAKGVSRVEDPSGYF